jgi:mono/diheme cytochrome c family protein
MSEMRSNGLKLTGRQRMGCAFMIGFAPGSMRKIFPSIAAGVACVAAFAVADAHAADELQFNRDIRPILSENCFRCHGPDVAARQADLRLDDASAARHVLTAAGSEQSELLRRILTTDPAERMPPADSGKTLTEAQKKLLARWVSEGADFQPHWAFIPPVRPALPAVQRVDWPGGAIDRFVLRRLEDLRLSPSSEAPRATLLRRVTLDLTGLSPTPKELSAFLADTSDAAYQRQVDRLLASPRYGEHMAAAWLEAARYADTDGYQNDRYRYQHVWRDWVILAFNENKPFDEFVVEQVAGDMLKGSTLKQQIATGFGRNHRINSEDGSIPAEWQVEYVVDRVDTLGTVFLGLTVGCARCHDHKYDPVSQKDYYRLFAYFNNVPEWGVGPNNGNSPPFVQVPASWPHLSPEENRFCVPEPVQLRNARTEMGNGLKRPQPGGVDTVMVMHEMDKPRPTFLLQRGQYNLPDESERLNAGLPQALAPPEGELPRKRLELAQWLVRPDHPLLARVTVNRLWQQLFGVGLVKTSENFGAQGELPSHPELLDWLATELIHSGWNIKALQRQILLSSTYRQSSKVSARLLALDPENRLLGRAPRSRLPAFVLRDQALAMSGLLVEKPFGPPTKPYLPPRLWESISNNKYEQDHGEALYRRSLYTFWRRTIPPPLLTTLNAADRETCVVRKDQTNTPLQALTLMNNVAFVEASRFLAERILRDGGNGPREQIPYAFLLTTARPPSAQELAVMTDAHQSFLKGFQQDPKGAKRLLATGEGARDASLNVAEHAAMTMTASLLLNLDETLSKE